MAKKKGTGKSKKNSKKKKVVVKKIAPKIIEKKHEGFFSRFFSGFIQKKSITKKKNSKVEKQIKNKIDPKSQKNIFKKELQIDKKISMEADKKLFLEEKKILKSKKNIGKGKNILERELDGYYIRTGIRGFDALFEKNMGVPTGASVLIEGGPGSGKTVFCLATLNELCKKGKKCLYMSFEEAEERLIGHMEEFNWNAKSYIDKGLLRVTRFDAIDVSRSIEALLSAAKKELLIDIDPVFFPEDFNPDFIVIDSLTSIASAFSGEESRFRIYMEQLFRYLEKNKITTFLIREVSSPSHVGTVYTEQGEAVSFLSDGIVVLYNVIYNSGKREFAIEILKMRGSSFKRKIVDFKIIDKKGVIINPDKVLKRNQKSDFKLT